MLRILDLRKRNLGAFHISQQMQESTEVGFRCALCPSATLLTSDFSEVIWTAHFLFLIKKILHSKDRILYI